MWSLFWRLDRIVFQIVNNMLLWCFNSDYMIKPLSHHLVIPHSRFELELEKKILLFSEQHQLSGYRKSCYDLNRHLTSTLWISKHIKHKFPETFFFCRNAKYFNFQACSCSCSGPKVPIRCSRECIVFNRSVIYCDVMHVRFIFYVRFTLTTCVHCDVCVCACVFSVATFLSNFLPFDSIDFQSKF